MKKQSVWAIVVLILALGAGPFISWRYKAVKERPNIIIFLVDTLRADHLGCYGFNGDISPNIDRLAKDSLLFEKCYSAAPWTLPSITSLFTSLPPYVHKTYRSPGISEEINRIPADLSRQLSEKFGNNFRDVFQGLATTAMPSGWPTLAEVLDQEGYQTACIVGGNFFVSRNTAVARGFKKAMNVYDENHEKNGRPKSSGSLPAMAEEVFKWFKNLNPRRPFFLYMHFNTVHGPYESTLEDIKALRYSPDIPPARKLTWNEWQLLPKHLRLEPHNSYKLLPRDRRSYQLLYAAGIRTFDRDFGHLMKSFDEKGLLNNTLIVLTSDHGEEFLEHTQWEHGRSLYNTLLHVPLIVRFPDGKDKGKKTDRLVSLLDVAPTLARLGRGQVPLEWQGQDLVKRRLFHQRKAVTAAGVEGFPGRTAAIGERFKLVDETFPVPFEPLLFLSKYHTWPLPGNGKTVLYDLKNDSGETTDVSSQFQKIVKTLRELVQRSAAEAPAPQPAKTVEYSEEEKQRLRSLGYM